MELKSLFALAADMVLLVHLAFVGFVIFSLLLVFLGKLLSWHWVRNPWFRGAHLLGVAIVVVQSWLGVICPLTTWEMALRSRAGESVYDGTFIAYWLHQILYYHAPPWVFGIGYTAFGALVLLSWFCVRPRGFFQASGRCSADDCVGTCQREDPL